MRNLLKANYVVSNTSMLDYLARTPTFGFFILWPVIIKGMLTMAQKHQYTKIRYTVYAGALELIPTPSLSLDKSVSCIARSKYFTGTNEKLSNLLRAQTYIRAFVVSPEAKIF